MSNDSRISGLLEQLRAALATTLDQTVRVVPAEMSARGWQMRLTGDGLPPLTLTVNEDGGAALAQVMGGGEGGASIAVGDALHEWCSQAVAVPAADGAAALDVAAADLVTWTGAPGATVVGLASAALPAVVVVALASEAAVPAEAPAKPARGAAGAVPDRLGVLLDIDLPMVVRFGCTDMPLKALSRLGPGSLIDLSRAPEEPVEVLVGGRVVARGEVVVVSGSYGIRIVDVVDGRDGMRRMEA